jgi:subtilisin family serine protease
MADAAPPRESVCKLNPLLGGYRCWVDRPWIPAAGIVLAMLAAPATASSLADRAAPTAAPPTPATAFSSDRVIVEWGPGADHADRAEARDNAEVEFDRDLGNREFQLVEVEPGQSAHDAIQQLRADPAVAVAERDSYSAPNALPNDPMFDQLWGLQNNGLGVDGFAGAVAGDDIDAAGAWLRTVGTPGTVVADIDSGYRFEHPDLANVAWTNQVEAAGTSGVDDDGNGITDDIHGADFVGNNGETPSTDGDPTDADLLSGGHGVHTAGTIGAQGNNGIGITGVAQDVRIMPLRVCSRFPNLEESRCPTSSQIAAINYAAAKGARVANMSLGGTSSSQAVVNAIAAAKETLFVISAGNDGQDNDSSPHYPCDYRPQEQASPPVPGAIDNIICVAATDQADDLASFSDWGATSVDLGAPGTETLSTYPYITPFEEHFSVDDFVGKWPATGTDGGFERTNEAPLLSFGMTDHKGDAEGGKVRETTSTPVTIPANGGCKLNQTRRVVLAGTDQYRYSVLLNGVEQISSAPPSTTVAGLDSRFLSLPPSFEAGGEVQVRFRFTTGGSPNAGDGVWLDDVSISCVQAVGQASSYGFLQGTSMAAPHVTGAAGLLFSLKPSATVTEVKDALLSSVDPDPALAGKTTTGGRLDASQAMDVFDHQPPAPPVLSSTDPASPAAEDEPKVIGSAEDGSTVRIYESVDCTGPVAASGSAAELSAPGIAVSVPRSSTTELSASATDTALNTSACSSSISYVEDTPVETEIVKGPPDEAELLEEARRMIEEANRAAGIQLPTAPVCTVPKLIGMTLRQATAALVPAHCEVGKVKRPTAKHGHKLGPLVVRTSNPASGSHSSSGKVDLTLGPKPKPKKRHH